MDENNVLYAFGGHSQEELLVAWPRQTIYHIVYLCMTVRHFKRGKYD